VTDRRRWRYWLLIPPDQPMPHLYWLAMREWLRYRDTEFGWLRLWVRLQRPWICQPYGGTRWYVDFVRSRSRQLIRSAPAQEKTS